MATVTLYKYEKRPLKNFVSHHYNIHLAKVY